jgi:hypothetical protein
MRKLLLILFLFIGITVNAQYHVYYCQDPAYNATYGSTASDANAGTSITLPWATWQKAFNTADAGDTVYFRGGVWYITVPAHHLAGTYGHDGTFSHPICFFAYPPDYASGNYPIIDAINFPASSSSTSAVDVYKSTHLKFKGLTQRNCKQTTEGQWIAGFSVVWPAIGPWGVVSLENMTSTGNGGNGFWISAYDTLHLVNCDSYNNIDDWGIGVPGGHVGGRADGYNITSGGSVADTFKIAYISGCRSWFNSDDAIDFGSTKQIDMHDCWMWANGRIEGDGNALKLEQSHLYSVSKRKIHNIVSAYGGIYGLGTGTGPQHANLYDFGYGIYDEVYNCFSYKDWNGLLDVGGDYRCGIDPALYIVRNNVVYAQRDTYQAVFKSCNFDYPTYVLQDHNTWVQRGLGNYWYTDPNPAYTVTDADFVSLDTAQLRWPRKADGSLPDITFGHLNANSDLIDAGTATIYVDNVLTGYSGSAPDLGAFEYSAGDEILVTSITVSGTGGATTISVDNGTLQMLASILPIDADIQTVTWSRVNGSGTASISSGGLLTALTDGTVTVRATAQDGSGVYDDQVITISNQVVATGTHFLKSKNGGFGKIGNGFSKRN